MKRIILIGYMGAGKTTLGKALARELNLEFIDLDWYIENRFHQSISQLFAARGEEGFRTIERNMLHEVAEFENVVISSGGGTPCFFDNMEVMNRRGITVYVKASVEQLVSRLVASKNVRPIIRNKSPEELKQFVTEHLAHRENYYSKANLTYSTELLVSVAHVNESVMAIKKMLFNNN